LSLVPPQAPPGCSMAEIEQADMQRQMDQTKKEVKQLRSMESRFRCDMQREETRQQKDEKRQTEQHIMEMRQEQSEGMKDYVREKAKGTQVRELAENKSFQEFKRDWKEEVRVDEIHRAKVDYHESSEQARWQEEFQYQKLAEHQVLLEEKLDGALEHRDQREMERMQELRAAEEVRQQERRLETLHQSTKLVSEKERLLKSLQLMRSCRGQPAKNTNTYNNSGFSAAVGLRR